MWKTLKTFGLFRLTTRHFTSPLRLWSTFNKWSTLSPSSECSICVVWWFCCKWTQERKKERNKLVIRTVYRAEWMNRDTGVRVKNRIHLLQPLTSIGKWLIVRWNWINWNITFSLVHFERLMELPEASGDSITVVGNFLRRIRQRWKHERKKQNTLAKPRVFLKPILDVKVGGIGFIISLM